MKEPKIIIDLRAKLNEIEDREAILKSNQSDLSFAAFAEGDAKAKAKFATITTELVTIDGERRGITAALAEAAKREQEAIVAEQAAKKREAAFEVEGMLPGMVADAREFDEALARVTAIAVRLDSNFSEARQMVGFGPERFTVAVNIGRAWQTATMGTVLHHMHLAPAERTDMARCVAAWTHQLKVAVGRIVGVSADKPKAKEAA